MKHFLCTFLPFAITTAVAADKAVQESNDYYKRPLDQLLQVETQAKAAVGSRSGDRDALDAEVPIWRLSTVVGRY